MTRTSWSPEMPAGFLVWHGIWASLIGSDGPSSRVPLRSLRSVLDEIIFQARLDQLAHPSAREGLRDELTDALLRKPKNLKLGPEIDLLMRHMNESKSGVGCSNWRAIEAAAHLGLKRIKFTETELRIAATDSSPMGRVWG